MSQKAGKLSKNTMKQLEKMQTASLDEGLKYDNFLKLNKLWL